MSRGRQVMANPAETAAAAQSSKTRRIAIVASAALLALLAGGYAALTATVTTRQGVNFRLTVRSIPLHVKAIDFLHRHYQYRLLAEEIAAGKTSDADRVLAVFDWTRKNIRRFPDGWPVVDDHILNIIIRGYGTNDQVADVFATLSTYAGVPSFWRPVRASNGARLIFTFAQVDEKWVPFDAWNGVIFRDARGGLADIDELIADPSLIDVALTAVPPADPVDYHALIARGAMSPLVVPQTIRSHLQRPWPRMRYEARRLVGLEHEDQ